MFLPGLALPGPPYLVFKIFVPILVLADFSPQVFVLRTLVRPTFMRPTLVFRVLVDRTTDYPVMVAPVVIVHSIRSQALVSLGALSGYPACFLQLLKYCLLDIATP